MFQGFCKLMGTAKHIECDEVIPRVPWFIWKKWSRSCSRWCPTTVRK